MTEAKTFEVLRVQNNPYMSKGGRVISGFAVLVYIPEFDEEVSINIPDNDPKTVKAAADDWLKKRREIANLG